MPRQQKTVFRQEQVIPTPQAQASVQTPSADPQETQRIVGVKKQADTVLFHAKTVFPFTIFPTEVIIDETKVSVIEHFLFSTGTIRSISYDDILNVEAVAGFIFGSLRICFA